jgi:CheY-like chemotaxis protein
MADRRRIILVLPDVTECATVAEWLVTDGFEPVPCRNALTAAETMRAGLFDLVVADAAVPIRDGLLAISRARNPLTPTVVIGNGTSPDRRDELSMYLGRPLDRGIFLCTVSMAMMDAPPPRRSARKTVNHFDAIVNGVPSHIIDVSIEGLRLEVPRQHLSVPPPYFNVRLPLVGITVNVQRIWTQSPGQRRMPIIWCGGVLSTNRPGAEQGWRAFVDMIPVKA